ncbi:MAG: A/G-specific adenine glycosylase [Epsilonproteobacteria bacterium]|nr:A/G-specific adenine glycosylase [Campylobacterota bacterium]
MYKEVHHSLLQWYKINGRHDLPWRITDDPYKIYLSEIMLQQTQVKTVLERFYFPFLEKFPTLLDVAKSDLDDVLKMWEGLGYYTRAKNLHTAARQCQGILPKNASELLELPGIGRSTAHAISAFAYKEALPILDANVKRILHRYFAIEQRDEKQLWKAAYDLFDAKHPFEYNQAMMDIGSMVCLAKNPLCDVCPFEQGCEGKFAPQKYPQPKVKKIKPIRNRIIVVYTHNGKFALSQRKERFLHGLWGFVQYEIFEKNEEILVGHVTQHYSHFTLQADVYVCEGDYVNEECEWFAPSEIINLSLSGADHKVLKLIV